MRVKLLKSWGAYGAGRYLDAQPNMASILIKRGMAIEADEKPIQRTSETKPNNKARGKRAA